MASTESALGSGRFAFGARRPSSGLALKPCWRGFYHWLAPGGQRQSERPRRETPAVKHADEAACLRRLQRLEIVLPEKLEKLVQRVSVIAQRGGRKAPLALQRLEVLAR